MNSWDKFFVQYDPYKTASANWTKDILNAGNNVYCHVGRGNHKSDPDVVQEMAYTSMLTHAIKYHPTKIIHSGPCTIVFWNDNTKTIVRCSENDTYDEYAAFCAALAIKIYGSNSKLKKMINKVTKEEIKKK